MTPEAANDRKSGRAARPSSAAGDRAAGRGSAGERRAAAAAAGAPVLEKAEVD